jgi:hypothetical protein
VKRFHNFRIKLPAGPIVQFLRRCLVRFAATIYTVARNRVERIGYREDARVDVDLFAS